MDECSLRATRHSARSSCNMRYRIRVAVLTGAVVELVLYGPLLLPFYLRTDTESWRLWLGLLEVFQLPSAALVARLLRMDSLEHLAAQYRAAHAIILAGEALIFLGQATILSCITLVVIYVLRLGQKSSSLLHTKFVVAILMPPTFLLFLTGVVVVPHYWLSEPEARIAWIAMTVSLVWLAAAALFLAMARLAKLTNGRLLS